MSTRTRNPGGRAFAMPTSHEVNTPRRRVEHACRVPGCGLSMVARDFDGVAYRECPNPEHPDTLSAAWDERAGQLELDAPAVFDVKGRL